MSTEPADLLIDAVEVGTPLGESVEAHLDVHPLPVDDAEVDRIAARLEARIRGPRRWPWALAITLAIAAGALFIGRPATQQSNPRTVQTVAAPAWIAAVPESHEVTSPRRVVVTPGSRALTSETVRTTVVLVQEGTAQVGSTTVGPSTWVLATGTSSATIEHVIFPDGHAPPPLHPDVWEPTVQDQLEALRWQSFSQHTLDTLDAILEAP